MATGHYDFSQLSVMVVDDNPFMCRVLAAVLHAMRIAAVRTVHDAAAALGELKEKAPDLMFVDLETSSITGIDLVRSIRRRENAARECPIIMVPTAADAGRVKRARNAGADYTITKPFAPGTIHRCLVQRNAPRVFYETSTYYGPDRRRKDRPFEGTDRRRG